MNMAARIMAEHRSLSAAARPLDERHHGPAAPDDRSARMGTPYPLYPLVAVAPVEASTMLAILGCILRAQRADSLPPAVPAPFGLVVDCESREAWIDASRVELTFQEFQLLDFLVSNPRKVFSREQLLGYVWGCDQEHGPRTVDVHVHRLRRKLGAKYGQCLVTVRQVGYKFVPLPGQPGLVSPYPAPCNDWDRD